MELLSVKFALISAVSLAIYFKMGKGQWKFLLAVSIVMLVLFSNVAAACFTAITVITIFSATKLMKKYPVHKKKFLIAALIINFFMLAALKYSVFNIIFPSMLRYVLNMIIPIGISFYTLQMVSYLLDCYWGVIEPEENIFKLALFCTYFPLLISGPICRYDKLSPQLFEHHTFDYKRVSYGLIRIAYGVFEKMAIANRMSYNMITEFSDASIIPKILLFPIQLYADFDGCMNIIMGISECFGIFPEENFKAPFFSETTQEFWQRWHITLGTWLKNYIMYPLLKSEMFIAMGEKLRKKFGKKASRNITSWTAMLALWICMGIWHGNGIKYIVGEGLWFWLMIVTEQIISQIKKKKDKPAVNNNFMVFLRRLRTYLVYSFGMIFFQAPSLGASFQWMKLFVHECLRHNFVSMILVIFNNCTGAIILIIGFAAMAIIDYLHYSGQKVRELLHTKKTSVRYFLYCGLVLMVILSLNLTTEEFLYAQF